MTVNRTQNPITKLGGMRIDLLHARRRDVIIRCDVIIRSAYVGLVGGISYKKSTACAFEHLAN